HTRWPRDWSSDVCSSDLTAASAPGSLSDPLCTNPGTQTALNCSGAQAANYPTFPSPFPAPTNFAYIPPFNEIAVSYDPSGQYHRSEERRVGKGGKSRWGA